MSRARQRSTVYAVADDLAQGIDDITYDWSRDRHQQLSPHTHQPDTEPATVDDVLDQANRSLDEARRILDLVDRLAHELPSHEPPLAPDVASVCSRERKNPRGDDSDPRPALRAVPDRSTSWAGASVPPVTVRRCR